jgi:hypothetical protein
MRNNSVLYAGTVALAFSAAPPVYATQTLACTFTKECIAGEPCEARDGLTASLDHDGQGWVMTTGDGAIATFDKLAGAPAGTMRLISTDLDPDASAAALLSVDETGQAIMSVQGYFPGLGAVTQLGQCTPEGE